MAEQEKQVEFEVGERVLYVSEDNVYKAKILDVIPPEHYKIKLIDVGNQIIEAHELRLARHFKDFEAKFVKDDCSGLKYPYHPYIEF